MSSQLVLAAQKQATHPSTDHGIPFMKFSDGTQPPCNNTSSHTRHPATCGELREMSDNFGDGKAEVQHTTVMTIGTMMVPDRRLI